mgnify:CR=1 FL=1
MAGASSATSSAATRAGELRAVATELERENGEDREVARLTVVATERTARSGANCCGGDGGGDLRRWAVKARSEQWLRGKRALGARLARRRRRRRSCWTRSGDAETAVATATPARWQRLRRPWWRKARERRWGRKGVSRGSGARRGGSSSSSTGEAASRWRRGGLALAGVTSLPALARAGS